MLNQTLSFLRWPLCLLLGPLSVQKRIRAVTQRRARQERLDPNQSVRPRELDMADFQ
jgi:heme exporter protein D